MSRWLCSRRFREVECGTQESSKQILELWKNTAIGWGLAICARALRDDPVLALEHTERRRTVQRALQRLSARLRAVLLMREQGFTHKEIGKILGISHNSVGPLAARGLIRLEEALRQETVDEP